MCVFLLSFWKFLYKYMRASGKTCGRWLARRAIEKKKLSSTWKLQHLKHIGATDCAGSKKIGCSSRLERLVMLFKKRHFSCCYFIILIYSYSFIRNHLTFSWPPKTATHTLIRPLSYRPWRCLLMVHRAGIAHHQAWVHKEQLNYLKTPENSTTANSPQHL